MYCKKCGKPLDHDAEFCPYCGQKVEKEIDGFFEDPYGDYWKAENMQPQVETKPAIGWCILAFLCPLGGIIEFFVFRHSKPKTAKWALFLGLLSMGINIIYYYVTGNLTV